MRALYFKPPDASDLAEFGLRPEDVPPPSNVEVWADNWEFIEFFTKYSTQWRQGTAGPTGLDYSVFFHEMDRAGMRGERFDNMLAALRIIESTALEEIYRK